jgi:mannose-6-phosphate isomerase-like protein (cupin superfamily)
MVTANSRSAAMIETTDVLPSLVRAGDGEALWFLGNLVTTKVTGAQTHGQLTVVEFLNPPGFAPPLHRHRDEDEVFFLLEGSAQFYCGDITLDAGPGDVVLLPRGLAHSFLVSEHAPLRTLQLTTPAGFEEFARAAGEPAIRRELPASGPVDPGALAHLADLHGVDIMGPPPTH